MERRGYKIVRKLGSGGFGEVYHVKKKDKDYAVKVIKCTENTRRGMLQELSIITQIPHHENILKFYDWFPDEADKACIIMEYCGHGDLNDFILNSDDKQDRELNFSIMFQLSVGLNFLHERDLIHRDVKPENVLLSDVNGQLIVKLADFGLSKILDTHDVSLLSLPKHYAETNCGTLYFMAPEVKDGHYNTKADVFSLGVVYLTLLCRSVHTFPDEYKIAAPTVDLVEEKQPIWKFLTTYENPTFIPQLITLNDSGAEQDRKMAPLISSMLQLNYALRPDASTVKNKVQMLHNNQPHPEDSVVHSSTADSITNSDKNLISFDTSETSTSECESVSTLADESFSISATSGSDTPVNSSSEESVVEVTIIKRKNKERKQPIKNKRSKSAPALDDPQLLFAFEPENDEITTPVTSFEYRGGIYAKELVLQDGEKVTVTSPPESAIFTEKADDSDDDFGKQATLPLMSRQKPLNEETDEYDFQSLVLEQPDSNISETDLPRETEETGMALEPHLFTSDAGLTTIVKNIGDHQISREEPNAPEFTTMSHQMSRVSSNSSSPDANISPGGSSSGSDNLAEIGLPTVVMNLGTQGNPMIDVKEPNAPTPSLMSVDALNFDNTPVKDTNYDEEPDILLPDLPSDNMNHPQHPMRTSRMISEPNHPSANLGEMSLVSVVKRLKKQYSEGDVPNPNMPVPNAPGVNTLERGAVPLYASEVNDLGSDTSLHSDSSLVTHYNIPQPILTTNAEINFCKHPDPEEAMRIQRLLRQREELRQEEDRREKNQKQIEQDAELARKLHEDWEREQEDELLARKLASDVDAPVFTDPTDDPGSVSDPGFDPYNATTRKRLDSESLIAVVSEFSSTPSLHSVERAQPNAPRLSMITNSSGSGNSVIPVTEKQEAPTLRKKERSPEKRRSRSLGRKKDRLPIYADYYGYDEDEDYNDCLDPGHKGCCWWGCCILFLPISLPLFTIYKIIKEARHKKRKRDWKKSQKYASVHQ